MLSPAMVGFRCNDRDLSMPYVEAGDELIPLLMLLSLAFAGPAASVSVPYVRTATALRTIPRKMKLHICILMTKTEYYIQILVSGPRMGLRMMLHHVSSCSSEKQTNSLLSMHACSLLCLASHKQVHFSG